MELDVKQQVLVAIYTEYQKDIPMIHKEVTPTSLGIEKEKFDIAIAKLENEGYINNSRVVTSKKQREGNQWGIAMVMLDFAKMTPYGIDYVEKIIGINNTDNAKSKVSRVVEKCGNWGMEQLKDFGVRVLSEVINHQLDKMI